MRDPELDFFGRLYCTVLSRKQDNNKEGNLWQNNNLIDQDREEGAFVR